MELINRDEAIEIIVEKYGHDNYDFEGMLNECKVYESRPKGEFEYLGESKRATYVDMYKCSNCDFVSLSLGDDFLNYCPHCGAMMREE